MERKYFNIIQLCRIDGFSLRKLTFSLRPCKSDCSPIFSWISVSGIFDEKNSSHYENWQFGSRSFLMRKSDFEDPVLSLELFSHCYFHRNSPQSTRKCSHSNNWFPFWFKFCFFAAFSKLKIENLLVFFLWISKSISNWTAQHHFTISNNRMSFETTFVLYILHKFYIILRLHKR